MTMQVAELIATIALVGLVVLGAWRSRTDRRVQRGVVRALRG